MIKTIDFNDLAAGTVVDDEYRSEGVTISASGGSGRAMIFDSANPTGGDRDLASDTLGGLLIISEDGDRCDPDDNARGGSLLFDFDAAVRMESLTFKDIEETGGGGTRVIFYDAHGDVIETHFIDPTGNGGERCVAFNVAGVSRMEVQLAGSGAVDNLVFDDAGDPSGAPLDGYVDGTDGADLIDADYTGDPEGDRIDAGDAVLDGAAANDDFVRAGAGNDTVLAGAGDDRVEGGSGDDRIEGGAGDDTLIGGAGRDTVLGGDGDDLIDTSSGALAPDRGYPYSREDRFGFAPDADPENDRDCVEGGGGNDTIRTGDDRDTVFGGDGNDVIDAGIDDDTVSGGDGDDRIVGGEGSDLILGGAGDDTIYAGNDPAHGFDAFDIPDDADAEHPHAPDRRPDNGRDTVYAGDGDDEVYGGDDDDRLFGGNGDDYLDGGIDDDSLYGGNGDDTLIGGQGDDLLRGNRGDDLLKGGSGDDRIEGGSGDDTLIGGTGRDTMLGGGDRDVFRGGNAGDVIDGGERGDDFDTLDLRGARPEGGRLEIHYDADNAENGTVLFFDNRDDTLASGQLDFANIEHVIPCFTPGTRIATPQGERRVEELQVGDRVITRDNGIQRIRWAGARALSGAELAAAEHLRPVLIQKGALGNNLPERDMLVSPNHRVLVANDRTALYFEEREVLVAAKHLTGMAGIDIVEVSQTTYIHIMFDQHEVILSDGAWTESFQPGDLSLAGIGDEQRGEILELFPELATMDGINQYASARRSLKKHEARLLTE
ncbi:Hint domain-containing protein [Sulfitobacter aestuarii]|uniref:Hint domain-containing protein n=1 Tax=Sulfitobacter aestuarii TaxID=2161676 RepID=A0ABW5U0F8_9RHOB